MGLDPGAGTGAVIGWALDGFAIRSGLADGGAPDLDECHGATLADGSYAYYLTEEEPHGPTCLKGAIVGTANNEAPAEKRVCPKQGKEVSFLQDATVEGLACELELDVTGYLVDAATWTSAVDPATFDLKAACPGSCEFGIVVDASSSRRRLTEYELKYTLDVTGNDVAAAAVAASSKKSGWLVDVRGTLEDDGVVSGASVYVVGETVEHVGVVLDMQCWWRPQHPIALDGVDMVLNPSAHAVRGRAAIIGKGFFDRLTSEILSEVLTSERRSTT